MNAMTPGKPRPARGAATRSGDARPDDARSNESGVRLTMDFDDDVPLDQLPDGGIDPTQFGEGAGNAATGGAGRQRAGPAAADRAQASEDETVGVGRSDAGATVTQRDGASGEAVAAPFAGTGQQDARMPHTGARQAGARDTAGPNAADQNTAGPNATGPNAADRSTEARSGGRQNTGAHGAGAQQNRAADMPMGSDPAADDDWPDADSDADADAGAGAAWRDAGSSADFAGSASGDGWSSRRPAMREPPAAQRERERDRQRAQHSRQAGPVPGRLSAIAVTLSVELGRQKVALGDLMDSAPGQLFTLDRLTSEPVDIMVNGQLFARGDVVMIGDQFGVRLSELIDPEG